MSTRDIRTSHETTTCDVCGRTLLRGERADVWLNGSDRHAVCELCKTRALHEGWVREGTVPDFEGSDTGSERRRSLLGRLRARSREPEPELAPDDPYPGFADHEPTPTPTPTPTPNGITLSPPDGNGDEAAAPGPEPRPGPGPEPRSEPRRTGRSPGRSAPRTGGGGSRRSGPAQSRPTREPRHVRAVPSGVEQKIAAAAELFNGSEHRRTVSGVSRSLGQPSVSIAPVAEQPSLVNVVIAWELCWYRYDIDLSEDQPTVRVSGQGYELDELEPAERQPNAIADEQGQLSLPA